LGALSKIDLRSLGKGVERGKKSPMGASAGWSEPRKGDRVLGVNGGTGNMFLEDKGSGKGKGVRVKRYRWGNKDNKK